MTACTIHAKTCMLYSDSVLPGRCNAVHPGYGFLSENAEFVDMCEKAGIAFLGPRADTMRLFSRKHDARAFAEKAQVPILAGQTHEAGWKQYLLQTFTASRQTAQTCFLLVTLLLHSSGSMQPAFLHEARASKPT